MQSVDQVFPGSNNKKSPRKLGCAFALLPISAVVMLAVSIWYGYSSWNFYSNGVEVQGTVVRLESHSSDGVSTYSPVFSYTIDGQQYEYESVNSSSPPTHESAMLKPCCTSQTTRKRRAKIVFGNYGYCPSSSARSRS
jgi:hypothetical protein